MKTFLSSWSSHSFVSFYLLTSCFLAGVFPAFSQAEPADIGAPTIRSVRLEGTNVVVLAQVPSGAVRVTLECCFSNQ